MKFSPIATTAIALLAHAVTVHAVKRCTWKVLDYKDNVVASGYSVDGSWMTRKTRNGDEFTCRAHSFDCGDAECDPPLRSGLKVKGFEPAPSFIV